MSYGPHNDWTGFPRSAADGVYWFAGRANGGWSIQSSNGSHRWSGEQDWNGDTMCVQQLGLVHGTAQPVVENWKGFKLYKVKVDGLINSQHIREACSQNKLKPVCDHPHYYDGRCLKMPIGALHMSYGPHNDYAALPRQYSDSIYWYAGSANGPWALQSYHGSHRWSDFSDMNGFTMCALKLKKGHGVAQKLMENWRGLALYKVKVDGQMKQKNILAACKKNKMMPVCDHPAYNDNNCLYGNQGWQHLSYKPHNDAAGFPNNLADRLYMYAANANGGQSLQNINGSHRWSGDHEYGGETMCATRTHISHGSARKVVNKWRGFDFFRVRVSGIMNSQNIRNACALNGLQVPCDHPSWNWGECHSMKTGSLHMSYQPHNSMVNFPYGQTDRAYWYAGRANGDWSIQAVGGTHRWAGQQDWDGDTICIKPLNDDHGSAREVLKNWRGWAFFKVQVDGLMNSQTSTTLVANKTLFLHVITHITTTTNALSSLLVVCTCLTDTTTTFLASLGLSQMKLTSTLVTPTEDGHCNPATAATDGPISLISAKIPCVSPRPQLYMVDQLLSSPIGEVTTSTL